MESNVGRQTPASESVSLPAPREQQPTPAATRPADVSRVQPTSTMVLGRIHWRAEVPRKTGNASPTGSSPATGSRNSGGNGNIRSDFREKGIWGR